MIEEGYVSPIYSQEDWENDIKEFMKSFGWECDRDDESKLGFSFKKTGEWWIRDYDKKTRRFVHYNGNHTISIRIKNVE